LDIWIPFFIEFNGIPIIAASPLIAKWLFVNNDENAPDEHKLSQDWMIDLAK
jgi:hypothetical protein